ncbi:MAG: amidohydrolase family protein [Alphaproteobacteria bacterium]|nr:amidohydrolase family protein [Alphaproteobacteria bacterium]
MTDTTFVGWGGKRSSNGGEHETVFSNVRIIDGTGEPPYTGDVTVAGNRIRAINRSGGGFGIGGSGGQRIDGRGMTLMPGLVDAHLHLSWNNAPGIDPIQLMPPEEHALNCAYMAKTVLDAGFTAGYGAAAAKPRLDVVIRDAINAGRVPGPRYTAAGPELTAVGGLGDASLPHIPHEGLNLGIVVSGPEEMRRKVRELMKWGVDTIKINLSGEEITGMGAEENQFTDEEIAVAVSEARGRGRRLAAHARSKESIQRCVKFGIEIIYHASFSDNETLDMLEANKDKHFVAPGLAWLINTARNAAEYGIVPGTPITIAYERELEHAIETMKAMHRRGIRVLIGGDYGFAWTPHGTNAKDLEYFVDMVGMSPMEAIQAGTKYGGEIMGMGNELGLIREGYLADMLLVDGDPLANIRVLQDHDRLVAIMKDGAFHKVPSHDPAGMRLIA